MSSKYFLTEFARRYIDTGSDSHLFLILTALKYNEKRGRIKAHLVEELKDRNVIELDFKASIKALIDTEVDSSDERIFDPNFKIDSLQVKNFKGFGELNDEDKGTLINFIEDKNIFFAPNGGGKTSLCNALEYKLTGNIKEAKRRNLTVPQYIRRNDKQPRVKIEFVDDAFELNALNDYEKELLESAFIEHNRINAFALLGSRDSGDNHNDIISYVLGLEGLDDFISYFLKPASIELEGCKTLIANEELKEFQEGEKKLKLQIDFNKSSIGSAKENIKKQLDLNSTINRRLVKRKLKILDNKLKVKAKHIEDLSNKQYPKIDRKRIIKSINSIKRELQRHAELSTSIECNIERVNLTKLYEAISNLNIKDYEYCPACQTSLTIVSKNPFDYAMKSLQELTVIQTMQNEKSVLTSKLKNDRYNEVREIINLYNTIVHDFTELNVNEITEFTTKVISSESIEINRLDYLIQVVDFFKKNLIHIKDFLSNYMDLVEQHSKVYQEIKKMTEEKELITNKVNSIKSALTNWEDGLESIGKIRIKLNDGKEKVDKLIKTKGKEGEFNEFVQGIEDSYADLYNKLIDYKNEIQFTKFSGTECSILEFYTRMNAGDPEQEMIQNLSFELKGDKYGIMIDVNGEQYNAFSKLSEGHIRTLGLSIMLAIAKKNKLPFLIFDDVVNAIDTEHRANIIDLIYTDDYINNVQLIITTHDRLFWERFCNQYKSRGTVTVPNISNILEYTNKGIIVKGYNVDFPSKIKNALQSYDVRQALVYCRLWFETIAMKYCRKNKIEIKGRIVSSPTHTMMKPVLEDMYNIVAENYGGTKAFERIKKDLINWQGQNQEHHAFDESSYNFVHAKTSGEVKEIFEAIFVLNLKVFEENREKYSIHIENQREHNEKLEKLLNDPGFLANAPQDIINNYETEKSEIELELEKSKKYLQTIAKMEIAEVSTQ